MQKIMNWLVGTAIAGAAIASLLGYGEPRVLQDCGAGYSCKLER